MRNTLPIAIFLFIISGCTDNDTIYNPDPINPQDRIFVANAAMSNIAEIESAKLSITNSSDPSIKDYGNMIFVDHTNASIELHSIAENINLLIRVPDSLDANHVILISNLNTLSSNRFDSLYSHSQVSDHQNTIALYQKELTIGLNSQLKDYARKYIRILQNHLILADSLASTHN